MANSGQEVKRSLPGWSLARDAPRPKAKQGWECPAPTIEDWEDYKAWKEEQGKKDELPAATQIFLADTELLFYQDPDVQLPWVHRLKCELPRRVGRLSGELPVKASYIGFGTNDDPAHYEVFKEAMAQIGIVLCRQIHHPPNRFELAHLEQSDLILVGGGDRRRLWETLGTDIGSSVVAEHVKWRYLQGALVIAVGEAMSLLGEKSWYYMEGKPEAAIPFTGWKIFPHIVASEAEGADLEDLVGQFGNAGIVILGINKGGGMVFNRDGLVEPVRCMMSEYRWDFKADAVKQALLLGPPRGTGLICPLYAAMKKQSEQGEGDETVDAYSYALTQEEEKEEEQLIEQFDEHNLWLDAVARDEFETLKRQGNDAFKAGKADLAGISYEQARALLKSSAKRWCELTKEERDRLDALDAQAAKTQLPSQRRQAEAAKAGSFNQKEDYRATTLLTALLLNICATHLLAYEQDQETGTKEASAADSGVAEETTTIVEVRDNLVAAFRAANDALTLSGCRSAKAWYRRACAFEKMRDTRNAERDLDEALLRAPGDKAIEKKRMQVKEAAAKVAESMYYARHKEFDKEEQKLNLPSRRALYFRGSLGDPYVDERKEFAIAQPLARLVEGTLEDTDGRLQLVLPEASKSKEDAPYLHVHALWTWEFLVQRATNLQLLQIENVDLGSGPLEWICKGLRTHTEVRALRFIGVHLGPAGGRMMRNVLAQNKSLREVALDKCALLDIGLANVAEGVGEHEGVLEVLSLQYNHFTAKRLGKLVDALCKADAARELEELDLSGNPICFDGARELAKAIGSDEHRLRTLRLQDCGIDLAAFWRLVANLDDKRPLSKVDLKNNPIGRGTRRCWRSTMGPTIRCDILLSDHPLKVRKECQRDMAERDTNSYPLIERWA